VIGNFLGCLAGKILGIPIFPGQLSLRVEDDFKNPQA
jgi:hypothetical protein